MDTNQRKILEMLAERKITVEEAERLLTLLRTEHTENTGSFSSEAKKTKTPPKYLRVEVRPNPESKSGSQENVNIRVPVALIRAGLKLTSVIPPKAYDQVDSALKEKGIDFDMRNITPENLEEIIDNLNDLEVDVRNGEQTVHIYAE